MIPMSDRFTDRLFEFLTGIEAYESPYAETVSSPEDMIENLTNSAALKTASLSAALSLPVGIFSIVTILPELFLIYRIQGQLIKDIASLYGKEAFVTKELLIYCMFKQTSLHLVERIIEDIGTKIIIRPSTLKFLESLLQKIGIQVSKKIFKGSVLKFLPVFGAILTGGLTYLDTKYISSTAVGMFSKDMQIASE
jgi:hypothetical protein